MELSEFVRKQRKPLFKESELSGKSLTHFWGGAEKAHKLLAMLQTLGFGFETCSRVTLAACDSISKNTRSKAALRALEDCRRHPLGHKIEWAGHLKAVKKADSVVYRRHVLNRYKNPNASDAIKVILATVETHQHIDGDRRIGCHAYCLNEAWGGAYRAAYRAHMTADNIREMVPLAEVLAAATAKGINP